MLIYIFVFRRREIKHYLLSYSALSNHKVISKINNDSLAKSSHLYLKNNGDYSVLIGENGSAFPILNAHDFIELSDEFNENLGLIKSEKVKSLLREFIEDEKGFSLEKTQLYVNLIDPLEISEDIDIIYKLLTRGG